MSEQYLFAKNTVFTASRLLQSLNHILEAVFNDELGFRKSLMLAEFWRIFAGIPKKPMISEF
jgi:hypothetical protein